MQNSANTIQWQLFPRSARPVSEAVAVIRAFESHYEFIGSGANTLESNAVLQIISPMLTASGFVCESGKSASDKIQVPVLFGLNGKIEKSSYADAFHAEAGVVLEVEAGRAVVNNQFLKDLFQACMMQDAKHLVIAVRSDYRRANDFDKVVKFFDTLYASQRVHLPLTSILVLGY